MASAYIPGKQRPKYAPKPKPTDACQCTRTSEQKDFGELTHQYPYYDKNGVRLYSRFRYLVHKPETFTGNAEKTFRYCPHYDRTNPEHVALVYGLPRLLEAIDNHVPYIYLTEGEGDCEAAWALEDAYATTTHLGTRFPSEVAEHFRGYQGTVYIVVDRDHLDSKHKARFEDENEAKRRDYPGAASALRKRRALKAIGVNAWFREAAKGKDLRDHLEKGLRLSALVKVQPKDVAARAPREVGNRSKSNTLQLSAADMPEGPGMVRFIEALQAKGFSLEKIGASRYKTNCPNPNHEDRNPSFEFEQGETSKGVGCVRMWCESSQGPCTDKSDTGMKALVAFLGLNSGAIYDDYKAKGGASVEPPENGYCPPSTDPLEVIRHIADEFVDEGGTTTLYHWNDDLWEYNGRHFARIPESYLKSRMYKRMDGEMVITFKDGEAQPARWAPTDTKINGLVNAIKGMQELHYSVKPGTWLNGTATTGPVVPMTNGILQIRGRILEPSSAGYFNTWSVPYEYDPKAKCPAWDKFMDDVFGDDPESLQALQQWFGYLLSGRTDLQKMLLMTGPTRGGRGTIGRVLKALVGEESYTGLTLSSLATDFGLHKLVSKSVAVVGDSRTALRQGEAQVVVERLLSISGEDELPINRKGKDEISMTLGTRILAFSNELLGFRDSSNAITGRWIVIQMTKSFADKEDPTLLARLVAELPGIFNWALEGLEDLDEMGRFLQPESGKESVKNMQESASPEKEFLEDFCTIGDDLWCYTHELWLLWESQAQQDNRKPGNRNMLASKLAPVVQRMGGTLTGTRKRIDGAQVRILQGIGINEDNSKVKAAPAS